MVYSADMELLFGSPVLLLCLREGGLCSMHPSKKSVLSYLHSRKRRTGSSARDHDRFSKVCTEVRNALVDSSCSSVRGVTSLRRVAFAVTPRLCPSNLSVRALVFTFEETQNRVLLKGPRSLVERMYGS